MHAKRNNNMMISAVISSYNGMDYIQEQLESIRRQSRLPDEVLVSDDCSTDGTYEFIYEYINHYRLTSWKVIRNSENIGWKRNFHKVLGMTSCDVIFLCDQDDIWEKNKIEVMSSVLEENKNIDLLASSYTPFYMDKETPRISRKILNTMRMDGRVRKIKKNYKFMWVIRPGCTYAIRKSFYDEIQPFWDEDSAHDAILWRTAILKETAYLLDESLIQWRRYSRSGSSIVMLAGAEGQKIDLLYKVHLKKIKEDCKFINMLFENDFAGKYPESAKYMYYCLNFKKGLLSAYSKKSIKSCLLNYIQYGKSYYVMSSFFRDMQLIISQKWRTDNGKSVIKK